MLLAWYPGMIGPIVGLFSSHASGEVISRIAKDTLTAVELDHGDELQFTLRSGRTVSLLLEDTAAAVVERVEPGGIVYQFSCSVRVDGQAMTLRRFVCSQECFYEPYVVDGLRIWPDTVKAVFDLIPVRYPRKGNLQCVPRKAARLALQDAALRICPQETQPWLDESQDFLDVARCYNGDDCYLGPYLGQACHVGMDINHPKGSPLLTPIDFDTQAYFNSLAKGDNNNRWRGIRRWENGDVWALQTHHLIDLLVPQNMPLPAGKKYATTAGVHVGSHEHTHFEFKVGRKHAASPLAASDDPSSIACPIDFDDESTAAQENPEVLHLDPWTIFWQIFEDRKARHGTLHGTIEPLAPARTGQPVNFSASFSGDVNAREEITRHWTFGDGGYAIGPAPQHVIAKPGVYPVTLIIDDGMRRVTATQHLVVNGEPIVQPVIVLDAPDEPSFRRRPVSAADVYGKSIDLLPHTLRFVARASRPAPHPKLIQVRNEGGGNLQEPFASVASDGNPTGWLKVLAVGGDGAPHSLQVSVDATGLGPGCYPAAVTVSCDGAANSPQHFRVVLDVPEDPPADQATIGDADDGFYATPYFWVGHRFCRCPPERHGHAGFYLSNGGLSSAGEFVRFTPDLKAGTYAVSFSEASPFGTNTEFEVRVRHRGGMSALRVRPDQTRRIGVFEFDEGTDGYVEIHADGSKGLIIADAVEFRSL